MGRAHGVDEVSCAHSGQKPAWLISRNSSISFEPTFTEYAAEIAPFFTLISLVWNRKNTHVSTSSLATITLFPVPATRHGHILYYSHCSSTLRHTRVSPPGQDTSGFHLQKNTLWGFMVCPPKRKRSSHEPWDVTDRHGPVMCLVLPVLLLLLAALRLLAGGGIVRHLLQGPIGFFDAQLPQLFG